ncbi:MAG: response regulator [Desulfobacula sp.]|nr:response regulator [Desulfobacula sp.]
MRKRILFVDDEVNILKGLQRSLRPLRKQWEMVFSEGAGNALKMLGKQRIDVIVSDMRMPGMDGTQLREIVKQKYPEMVRIILSGHSDQEMIMKTVKSAHQYLSKPCEKDVIVNAINRSLSLRDLLNQPLLLNLLGGIETMPSLPVLYAQVMEALKSETASIESVGKIIAKDMGMTAKVLQLVNSSFFGMPTHISSAREAVTMLGIDVVKTLVLGIEVFSALSKNSVSVIPIEKIHGNCVKTAGIAREIAIVEKMGKEEIDNVMIASILHDLGKLILIEYFPDKYKNVIEVVKREEIPVFEAETKVFGVSHAQVGAYVLGLWGLPDNVIEAIAFHHHPEENMVDGFDLCGVVHVAELMEYHEQYQPGTWETLIGVNKSYLGKCNMIARIPMWRDNLRNKKQGWFLKSIAWSNI